MAAAKLAGRAGMMGQWLLDVIRSGGDLSQHHRDAVNSLKIVLAADRSIRTGQTVEL